MNSIFGKAYSDEYLSLCVIFSSQQLSEINLKRVFCLVQNETSKSGWIRGESLTKLSSNDYCTRYGFQCPLHAQHSDNSWVSEDRWGAQATWMNALARAMDSIMYTCRQLLSSREIALLTVKKFTCFFRLLMSTSNIQIWMNEMVLHSNYKHFCLFRKFWWKGKYISDLQYWLSSKIK